MAGCGGGGSCGLCAPAPTAPTILASDRTEALFLQHSVFASIGTLPTGCRLPCAYTCYHEERDDHNELVVLVVEQRTLLIVHSKISQHAPNTPSQCPLPYICIISHKTPFRSRPAQIARNDSASDMLELDERLGASWTSASASAACIEKPKVAARYCA